MRKYPFFIVVDDGGFPSSAPASVFQPADMTVQISAYETIVRLAAEFGMRIPVCFTMKYLDVHKLSACATPLPYAAELLEYLKENSRSIEFGYHGLTHEYNGCAQEFFCLDTATKVPEETQRQHIQSSAEIFKSLGMEFPKIFVPPCHAWEGEVTDRLLAEYGVKYLISFESLNYKGMQFRWSDSTCLRFLHREEFGVYARHETIPLESFVTAKKLIVPRSLKVNLLGRRRLFNPVIHSYMTHIGNFLPHNYGFWTRLFEWVLRNPDLELCKDNNAAVEAYCTLSGIANE